MCLVTINKITKETLIYIALEYDIINVDDVEKFAEIYNQYDEKFINYKFNRISWWTLLKDKQYSDNKYNKLIVKHEKLICERIKKRIKK